VGSLFFEVDTRVLFEQRLVELSNPRIVDMKFSGEAPSEEMLDMVNAAMAMGKQAVVLDFLMLALPADFKVPGQATAAPQLNFQPPRIIVSNRPLQLMLIDGPPSTAAVQSTGLEYVVNTDWDIFHHSESDKWYVLNEGVWQMNSMLAGGDWISTTELPQDFLTLEVSSGWERVNQALPPRKPETRPVSFTISYEPAELILIDGETEWEAISRAGLEYVSNTQSDLFRLDGRFYLLASGRWFSTKNLKRRWTAVKRLPAVFAKIPGEHRKSHVLASVPGTTEARMAVIEASIPSVEKYLLGTTANAEVGYAGEPSFVAIEGTTLRRAVNTPYQVIQHNNFYYLCFEGAWYLSTQAAGPWTVATELPEAIYTIPATDPAYNVTFVKLKSFDDSSNEVAYTSTQGYTGSYYNGSTMVYGTGWYYPGYIHHYGSGYPGYWRYPYSYGWGARYYPRYGRYGFHGYYDPFMPYGGYSSSYTFSKPNHDKDWEWNLDGSKREIHNYGQKNYIGQGTYKMYETRPYDDGQKAARNPARENAGYSLSAVNNGADDLYSGQGGEIYRKSAAGWQKLEGGSWKNLQGAEQEHLDRQYQARQEGYRNYDLYQQQEAGNPR
jgi:hypothetical protein